MPHNQDTKRDELFRKNKKGDLKSRDELFSLNLPKVLALVKRVSRGREDFDDLFRRSTGIIKSSAKI